MPDGLAFTLYAPFAALGDLTVGETRSGFDRPARSAIFGLVAAALGYDRHDEAKHAALDRAYRLAQRVRLGGVLVKDYHTTQAPSADRKSRWTTRREALDRPSHKLNTQLSSRDYRADLWVDIALVRLGSAGDEPPPEAVAEALRRPAYTLYVGRKSCPLGRPLAPEIEEGITSVAGLLGRLDERTFGLNDDEDWPFEPLRIDGLWVDPPGYWNAPLYADAELAPLLAPDFEPLRVERRRDRVASRRRWQFELRDEIVAQPVPSATTGPEGQA